jgi:hypothetical protein
VRLVCSPALHLNCASNVLYGLTGGNGATESYRSPRSLVRINKSSGAATVVCSLSSTEQVQAFAFVDDNTALYFTGTATPQMFTLQLSQQTTGTSCRLTAVPEYAAAALVALAGSAAAAATPLGDGTNVLLSAGAHVFVVSKAGAITDLGLVHAAADGTLVSVASLAFSTPCTAVGTLLYGFSHAQYTARLVPSKL